MGLDMYLDRHTSFSRYPKDAQATVKVFSGKDGEEVSTIDFAEVGEVVQRAKYWRKDNAIHQWFVNNIQDGVDDCGTYSVSREQLQELYDTCLEVLRDPSKAEVLLPPQEGFFFGSTEIDEFYWEALKETADAIGGELRDIETKFSNYPEGVWGVHYTYHSSW